MENIICLLIGGVSGAVAALCGVGGGVILVPAFKFLGLDQKQAVATSLAVIILMSLAASLRNAGSGLVIARIAVPTALGGALLAWLVADHLKRFSNLTLTRMFAVFIICMGTFILANSFRSESPHALDPASPPAVN